MLDNLQAFVFAAIAIEGLISWGKAIYINKKVQWPVIISLVLSLILVYDFQLNLFDLLGVAENIPYIGMIITAVAISRGTNYFYELYDRLINWKNQDSSTAE